MKPIATTGDFLRALYLKHHSLKDNASCRRSLSIVKEAASNSARHYLCNKDSDACNAQSNNRSLTEGDIYILENGRSNKLMSPSSIVRRGKLVNIDTRPNRNPVALVVTVVSKESRIGVSIHLLPTGADTALPPQLSITLLSNTGNILQSATSKAKDDCIELKPFEGNLGVCFTVEVSLNGIRVSEAFQL